MVDTTKAMESDYLTVDTVKELDNKEVAIIDEGSYEASDYGERFTFTVGIEGKRQKIWRPNKSCVKTMADAWGRDSKQ